MKKKKRWRNWIYAFMTAVLLTGALDFSKGNTAEASQPGTESDSTNSLEGKAVSEQPELTQLQIPQRMEIVIDPWEMDGREQIYSKEYTVQNTGETPGILILDFSCKVSEEAGLFFLETQDGLHDSEEKRIYMKALFGSGEEAVFSQEGVRYQTELQPGEELSLRFTGGVNENADEPWKDGDIEIEGTYSWMGVTVQSDETEKEAVSEDVLPERTEQDVDGGIISTEQDGQNRTKEEQILPGQEEQDGISKEQSFSSEAGRETDKENSLSGNELEE